jgi:hypothetical protein
MGAAGRCTDGSGNFTDTDTDTDRSSSGITCKIELTGSKQGAGGGLVEYGWLLHLEGVCFSTDLKQLPMG